VAEATAKVPPVSGLYPVRVGAPDCTSATTLITLSESASSEILSDSYFLLAQFGNFSLMILILNPPLREEGHVVAEGVRLKSIERASYSRGERPLALQQILESRQSLNRLLRGETSYERQPISKEFYLQEQMKSISRLFQQLGNSLQSFPLNTTG